jgi:LmbE family N-acetylglucosaminyl deacetylase
MNAADALPRRGEHAAVVVAHPDDESFGCGSLIARAVSAGARVTVVCATRGEAGERVGDPTTDHLPLADVRERELRAAAAALGATSVVVLGLDDSGFDGPMPATALCSTPPAEVAAMIRTALADDAPHVVITIDGSDGHRDHAHIRDAVDHLATTSASPLRVVHSSLPRSLMVRWVDE